MADQQVSEVLSESQRAKSYRSWALTENVEARMAPAWRAKKKQYEDAVDPEGVLPPDERERRAVALRRADMAKLSAKAAEKRRERREAQVAELFGDGA